MKKVYLFALITLSTLNSCMMDASCPNNEVFQKYAPDSHEYKTELVHQLQNFNTEKLNYYIENYSERDNKQYLLVVINSDELCAFITMDITNCDKLRYVKEKKGGGYSGAGLTRPKFRIDSSDGEYKFILDDLSRVSD